jgi:lipoate-protein ligase A
MTPLYLLELSNIPILDQLRIEEALLRLDDRNICIFNHLSSPAIVMGVSSEPEDLLDIEKVERDQIPIIRRYSGGGTVFIDENTLFVSFLFQKEAHIFPAFPERIMRWSENFYKEALQIPSFAFRENDYVIESKKVGGNAQYIQKTKWLHHTSFLYDFDEKNMDYLLMPKKVPSYREQRSHKDFLTTLRLHIKKDLFFKRIKSHLKTLYDVKPITRSELDPLISQSHRKSTALLSCISQR